MAAYQQELEKLPQILDQFEDLNAALLPQAIPHRAIDRASIRTDYRYALRHYFDGAASTSSGIKTPSTPSFQASALETSSSLLTSEYHTAPMSQISNAEYRQPSRKCTQVLVRNVGVHQTMAFQVAPEDSIGTIKSLVRGRIGLEHASFELLYSSRVLNSSDKSLDEYGIPHDATLTCLSFRPNIAPLTKTLRVIIKTLTDTTFPLSVEADTPVREVKKMSADWLNIERPTDIRLIHAGKQLADDRRLFDYGIGDEDKLYLVMKLGGPPAASDDKIPRPQEDEDEEEEGDEGRPLSFVIIKTIMGITFPLPVQADTLVGEVKQMSVDWLRVKRPMVRPTELRLNRGGVQLEDHRRLSDCSIRDGAKLYLIVLLGGTPEARPPDSEPRKIGNQGLSFWKAPFRTPWVPRRRIYGGIKT